MMQPFLRSFLRDRSGTTSMEYGLIALLISIVIIGTVTLIGQQVKADMDDVDQKVDHALNAP